MENDECRTQVKLFKRPIHGPKYFLIFLNANAGNPILVYKFSGFLFGCDFEKQTPFIGIMHF